MPNANSPAAELLANLRNPNPVAQLQTKVTNYQGRLIGKLSNPATRRLELERLHQLLLERRRAVNNHPVPGYLNETEDRLFPLPLEN